jgi:ribonucleoside-diphosphate reductase alpha chain
MSTSVIDYIFRELAVTYLGRNDLAHVDTSDVSAKTSPGIIKKISEPEFVSEEVVSERLVELDKGKSESYSYSLSSGESRASQRSASGNGSMTQKIKRAIEQGYTGDICTECQSVTMVRNGTCLKCMTCGSTSGCS